MSTDLVKDAEVLASAALKVVEQNKSDGPLSVVCPYCHSPAGWPCRPRFGGFGRWVPVHMKRMKAARIPQHKESK